MADYAFTDSESPTKIDIYVDGSWLHAGKRNPVETGGWGAVIVETYRDHEESWTPSAPTSPHVKSSDDAEIAAALGGLEAVRQRQEHRPGNGHHPPITLHTDVVMHIKYLRSGDVASKQRLQALLKEMRVKIVRASHDKTGGRRQLVNDAPEMATAHELASKAAWADREQKQGGRINIEPGSDAKER